MSKEKKKKKKCHIASRREDGSIKDNLENDDTDDDIDGYNSCDKWIFPRNISI